MEQFRTRLMAKQPQWGDSPSPPHLSKHVDFGLHLTGLTEGGSGASSPSAGRSHSADSRDDSLSSLSTSVATCDEEERSLNADAQQSVPDELIMTDMKNRRKPVSQTQPTLTCKDWSRDWLLSQSKNFEHVPRVRWSANKSVADQIKHHEATNPGVPLVVEGLHKHSKWPTSKFTPKWFQANGPDAISVRNVHDRTDKDIAFSDFIARTRAISPFKTPDEKERLYGKDVVCPPKWNEFLHSGGVLPPNLTPDSPDNLLNNLPKGHRPETLMCYVGVGDTFTPCHKDLCASSGHNLMCYTEKGGSSFWFMTATSSANAAAEYFQTKLNQVLDHEAHVITIEELAKAPFTVYITEQKLGDLVLVPPRSMHQVVNSGGITFKTSWSRMTLDGLTLALRYELPLYRRVCRTETYRVKATIYHTLLQMSETVSNLLCAQPEHSTDSRNAIASTSQKDMLTQLDALRRTLLLFDSILIEEYSTEAPNMRKLAELETKDEQIEQITCDFCGGDIFLSFFECRSCVNGPRRAEPGAGFIVCPGCYVEGRTCACQVMCPMQCRHPDKLFQARARAVDLFTACSGLMRKDTGRMLSNQELRKEDKLGLFRAAIVLRKQRLQMTKALNHNDLRRCTRAKSEFHHDAPNPWTMKCAKCHSGFCFAHMAWSTHLHSAEAFLAYEKDPKGGSVLHSAHLASSKRYSSEIAKLRLEAPDYVPDLEVQLAYLATNFPTCRPVAANSKLWKSGHYDLQAWEIGLPKQKTVKAPKFAKIIPPQPAPPKAVKRFVLDYVLMPSVAVLRPAKRKDRTGEPAVTAEPSVLQVSVRMAEDDGAPLRKRPKLTEPPRGPPVILRSTIPEPKRPAAGPSRPKNVILSDTSDSEEERPLKLARIDSRTSKTTKVRFEKNTTQPASSVAAAFNTAHVQNSKSIPNAIRSRPPPASAPAPALSRRKTKPKAGPIDIYPPSSPPEELSASPSPPASAPAPAPPQRKAKPKAVPISPPSSLPEELSASPSPPASAPAPAPPQRKAKPKAVPISPPSSPPEELNTSVSSPAPAPAPALPRRKTKQKAVPVSPPSSSPEETNTPAGIQDQLDQITEHLSMISAAQTQHDVERGHVSDFAAAKERQSLKAKQKAVPASRGGASSSGPSNSRPSPGIQDQLSAIMDRISTISAVQDRQTAELREMQRREVGRAPRGNAPEIQGLVDFVRGMVSALAPQLQPPPASSSNIGFPTRKWPASYRGRSRGRGGSVSFGDHLHRSMPSRDISEYRQARHQQHFGYRNAPFPPPRQHAEQQYGYERVWVPGPHAHAQERERERERERHEEPERYHAYAEDDRREPQERPRKRRFTRFSPPNSPGNGLDLVLVPRSTTRPLPPVRGFEGEDGSEGSGNVNDPSGSIQLFRRQTPATGANASGLADKFFRSLQRPSRSPTPYDDQDWETSYEKNIDKN